MADRAENFIESCSALDAFIRAGKNELRKYPSPGHHASRLLPVAQPTIAPKFEISETDSVFAIGSCFARNIERSMNAAGRTVLSGESVRRDASYAAHFSPIYLNKYGLHSIMNELRYAVSPDQYFKEGHIFQLGEDSFVDLQLGKTALEMPKEQALAFRKGILKEFLPVWDADVVVLTLGYIETWFDRALGVYTNVAPTARLVQALPDRFEFRVLSYQDVLNALNDLYAVLTEGRKKPLRLVTTLSPVPLNSTFRNMDVLVANQYSKAVQRAALDEFIRDKDNVDYFPSYEFVALSSHENVFTQNDYRHVRETTVDAITQSAMKVYAGIQLDPETEVMSARGLLNIARTFLDMGEYGAALSALSKNKKVAKDHPLFNAYLAAAHIGLKDYELALKFSEKALKTAPDLLAALEAKARAIMGLGKTELIEDVFGKIAQIDSGRAVRIHAEMKRKLAE